MSKWDSVYVRLPTPAQNAAISIFGLYWHWLRFGPGYVDFVREYEERERFTVNDWARWQASRLREQLTACANHVPYYREHWSAAQKRAAARGELGGLPLLEKEPIRSAPTSFLRDDLTPRRPHVFLTSGTTGMPISTYFTVPELRASLALREARSARWAGVSFSMPRATFSGRLVEPDPHSAGPFHRVNLVERQVYFSAFHLRSDTAIQYVDALRLHKIAWGTGYAVSYYLLARFMLERHLSSPPLKAIITTSEILTVEMRQVMEQAYGCRVFEEYSTVENAVFAGECENGRLHVSPDVSIVEILSPDGRPCPPGELGEVVATVLSRTYQPLIRFRLGDLAMWDTEQCPCGRQMPVIKEVVGRIEDVIAGPDGRQMVRFHGVFVGQPHVREGQVVQEALDRIRVKVVPTDGFGQEDIADIIRRVQQRLGNGVTVVVEQVKDIPRTPAGKFQAVVSKLQKLDGDST